MKKPLFDLDQAGMQAEVNSYTPGSGLVWATLFPLKYTPKFDLKGIEGNEGIPVSANRVSFNTKAPLKTRKTVGTWSGQLSKIAISREKNEQEINDYNDLKVIAANNKEDKATAQYLVDMVYDDIKFVNDGLDTKIEIDALRIGSSGKQTFIESIDGDMANADEIDFNIPTGNFFGVGSAAQKWSAAATADGIALIAAKQKAIASKGNKKPKYAIMSEANFLNLCAQEATFKRLFPMAAVTGTSAMADIENINAYMLKKGYPQIVVIDSYATIQDNAGNETTIQPWAENVVVLSPTVQLGWTYYKPVPNIPNSEAVQAQGSYAKTTVYSELNPMVEVTMGEAYVQCGLINRASLAFINTNENSWS